MIKEILNNLDVRHSYKANKVAQSICCILNDIVLEDDAEDNKFYAWQNKIKSITCDMFGHKWIDDHCAYWGHKYCGVCDIPKYPSIVTLSCHEAFEIVGNISEEEYCCKD